MDWVLPEADSYFRQLLMPEGFEINHLQEALKFCPRFRTAVDGGAHIGTWSVHMAKRFQKVLAFEPALDTYVCLAANTIDYNNIMPINAALGPEAGRCIVVNDPTRIGNTGARTVVDGAGRETVPVDALDQYNLVDLDFLKLDVEGAELLALIGAVSTIKRCKPTILVECKNFSPPRHGGPEATIKFLKELGYRWVGGLRNDRVFIG